MTAADCAKEILKEAELRPGYSEFHWNEAGISAERLEAIIQRAIDAEVARVREQYLALQRRDVVAERVMGYMTSYRCVNDDNGDYVLWHELAALSPPQQEEG